LHEDVNIGVNITAGIVINRFCFVLLSGPETSTLIFWCLQGYYFFSTTNQQGILHRKSNVAKCLQPTPKIIPLLKCTYCIKIKYLLHHIVLLNGIFPH